MIGCELTDSILVDDLAHNQTSFFYSDIRVVDLKLIWALFNDFILRELKHNFGLNVRSLVVSLWIEYQFMMVLRIFFVMLLDAKLERLLNNLICRVVFVGICHDLANFFFKKRHNAYVTFILIWGRQWIENPSIWFYLTNHTLGRVLYLLTDQVANLFILGVKANFLNGVFHDLLFLHQLVIVQELWISHEVDVLVTNKHSNFYFWVAFQISEWDELSNTIFELNMIFGPLLISEIVRGKVAAVADKDPAVRV